ncbi:MAG: fatty acid desaturase [Planctomycetaceae bacterium]|nr:fatty acid desaturase [Planctomycetaceae bacterium]
MVLEQEPKILEAREIRARYPIPNVLNLAAFVSAATLAITFLTGASIAYRSSQWGWFAFCVLGFGLINNTNFSLLHEAVHGILNSNRRCNEVLGILAGSFFPTSYTLQQYFHLGHHCRNRTDAEMFDLYYPTDNLWIKRFVIYAMPAGLYWMSAASANVLFLFLPSLLSWGWLRESRLMKHSGFDSMLSGIPDTKRMLRKIRSQIVVILAIQIATFWVLEIHPLAWLACYWVFGMIWGSLQYTDHAFSPRDIRYGAWNLKVDPITRWIFLNYHYHLVHHIYPSLPWVYLPKFVGSHEKRPSAWGNFCKLMCGPFLTTEPPPATSREMRQIVYDGTAMSSLADVSDRTEESLSKD